MSRRGDVVVMACMVFAIACAAWGIVVSLMGDEDTGVFMVGLACFSMLTATYLEVYSHRG